MYTQTLVKRTLSTPDSITLVNEILRNDSGTNRTRLADEVCRRFGFYDLRKKVQRAACLKALRELETAGQLVLPAPAYQKRPGTPRHLTDAVAQPTAVPAAVEDVQGLSLQVVETTEQMRIWNELMLWEHPQGAGPLVGRQIRYLVSSAYGWLGGVGFAAAALQLADRDRWIGWDATQRRAYLHTVVGMSRFLIRSTVQCQNLASKVLSLSLAQLPADFERCFGYRPWLVESFVDTSRFSGVCYRAGNWMYVGLTKGRGRQDRSRRSALSRKAIYLYPLVRDFRYQMGVSPGAGLGALQPAEGLEKGQWAANEFGGAPLGDKRLSRRLVAVAAAKAEIPDHAFSAVEAGNWAAVKVKEPVGLGLSARRRRISSRKTAKMEGHTTCMARLMS